MILPDHLQLAFEDQVKQYTEEEKMPLLSKMELRAQDKGQQLGEVKMARKAALTVLQRRFGEIASTLAEDLNAIEDLALLEQLLQEAVAVESTRAFQRLLEQAVAPTEAENSG